MAKISACFRAMGLIELEPFRKENQSTGNFMRAHRNRGTTFLSRSNRREEVLISFRAIGLVLAVSMQLSRKTG